MTAEEPSIQPDAAVSVELKALRSRACERGIDVEGGWECRNGAEHPGWEVVVTEVSKPGDSA